VDLEDTTNQGRNGEAGLCWRLTASVARDILPRNQLVRLVLLLISD